MGDKIGKSRPCVLLTDIGLWTSDLGQWLWTRALSCQYFVYRVPVAELVRASGDYGVDVGDHIVTIVTKQLDIYILSGVKAAKTCHPV